MFVPLRRPIHALDGFDQGVRKVWGHLIGAAGEKFGVLRCNKNAFPFEKSMQKHKKNRLRRSTKKISKPDLVPSVRPSLLDFGFSIYLGGGVLQDTNKCVSALNDLISQPCKIQTSGEKMYF